ncbi:IS3 family transposase [Streptomyces flaveus]|uniref:Integrase catalytic domain-containing protein n=1 Tax=Streptomyces flaveus TaxID=66370 RepID=A0A917R9H3_9ACTN|nr:IS3 family transposase [Streptomyces flaveus]GGK97174.1 hypothetical protein GCM10010094_67480 [Streptomyces flaveus]
MLGFHGLVVVARQGRCRTGRHRHQAGIEVVEGELLNRRRWRTRLELSTALFEYLEIFHNRQRRHAALGMLSLVEYELRTAPVA